MDALVEPLRISSVENAPPDWSIVPFAVTCARCGHDLHGQTEPKCPACTLTFRWSDAVPIEQLQCASCGYHLYGLKETRCPECGKEFTWNEALADYHRQRKPLFEYQWRKRPIRSFLSTWWLLLAPKKLWSTFDLHDPPSPFGLLLFACGTVLSSHLLIAFIFVTGVWSYKWWHHGNWGRTSWRDAANLVAGTMLEIYRSGILQPSALFTATWFLCLALALCVFRQSMVRYRIKLVHVIRVVVFAGSTLPAWASLTAPASWITLAIAIRHQPLTTVVIAIVLLLGGTVRSIGYAYSRYLRMDHPWGVAVAAVLMASLGTATFVVTFAPDQYGRQVLWALLDSVGL